MIDVRSEIKPLEEVLIHRPGEELLNLMPDNLEYLLFDDIPFLKEAINEHNYFANTLENNGVKVIYLEDLMTEVIEDENIKIKFIKEYLKEANIKDDKIINYLKNIKDNKTLVLKTMSGITSKDLNIKGENRIIIDPMPNLYYTRDPFFIVENGVYLSNMKYKVRKREQIYGRFIFSYHKKYKKYLKKQTFNYHIEGGDILILNSKTLAIGLSERTEKEAIYELAKSLFTNSKIENILIVKMPKKRTYMHLDTILTMVDTDKFIYHKLETEPEIYIIDKEKQIIEKTNINLKTALSKYLNNVKIIELDDFISSKREQWSDGVNTLCIKPGTVIAYDRNEKNNQLLRENGIEVIEIKSSELSRGRGGPRCMSMPLKRKL